MTAKPLPFAFERADFTSSFECHEAVRAHIGNAFFHSVQDFIKEAHCAACTASFLKDYYGVTGFGVSVLYDARFGANAFENDFERQEKEHMTSAYEEGRALGEQLKATGLVAEGIITDAYDGPYREDFKAGLEDGSGIRTVDVGDLK